MGERSTDQARATDLVCQGCNTAIEWCSFCDRTDCGAAICYGCLVVDLHESLSHPHPHGG